MTIVTYYGKLKKLWEELGNFEQIPSCKCGLCKCNLGSTLEKKREEEKVHKFLMGLDETVYATVRSNLLAQDPLPTLNKMYSTLVQEEQIHTVTCGKDEKGKVMAFVVQGGSRYKDKNGGKEKIGTCIHCNRPGHDSESCFQIIGYPEWWGEHPRGPSKGNGRGKLGQHYAGSSGKGRKGTAKAHAAQATMLGIGGNGDGSNTTHNAINGLTGEQWQTLDRISRMVIGAGEQRDGLYYLDRKVTVASMKTMNDMTLDLWHKRLRHASFRVLGMIPHVKSSNMAATPLVDIVSDGRTINIDSTATTTVAQQQIEQRSTDLTQQGDTASEGETINTDSTETLGRDKSLHVFHHSVMLLRYAISLSKLCKLH
ncbi:hypothetical protein V8G54_036558 [Vigna mungo]|uniref:GAG-pre-integrase domain-containing protein n=1 Tax=Vigna mungo TaxID=3915 RepID=A0AAQ3MH09_VIGMU